MTSYVFKTSCASLGADTTTVGTCPSCKYMIGPYFLAKLLRTRCGPSGPLRWCMFPSIGSFGGPGGKFFVVLDLISVQQAVTKTSEDIMKEKMMRGSMALGVLFRLMIFVLVGKYSYLYVFRCMG